MVPREVRVLAPETRGIRGSAPGTDGRRARRHLRIPAAIACIDAMRGIARAAPDRRIYLGGWRTERRQTMGTGRVIRCASSGAPASSEATAWRAISSTGWRKVVSA